MAANVRTWPDNSLERKAYTAVEGIPFIEMNDGNRLGYHVFLFLTGELESVEQALHVAQARMKISSEEAAKIITGNLERLDAPAPAAAETNEADADAVAEHEAPEA